MKMKSFLSVGLCAVVLSLTALPASAATVKAANLNPLSPIGIVQPYYVNIGAASSTLVISASGKADIQSDCTRTSSGHTIYLESVLQKASGSSWTNVKKWSVTTKDNVAIIAEQYQVSKGKYRVATTYVVNGATGAEQGLIYSKTVTY
ncbi:hypothetical protein [Clostridium minihomine]|uniref:hypothetical protein n=1 Tax=Clostridium minihomine TaxID=2045012 RepID=UPI001FB370E2|nr:hypothetical protein [Clostridium minihomine]